MKNKIVGRKKEIKKLEEILASKEAEFLALYGRRSAVNFACPCFFQFPVNLK